MGKNCIVLIPAVLLFLGVTMPAFSQQQQGDFTPVTATRVKGLLDKSAVANIHPRLFFNKKDIDRVKRLYNQGDTLIRIGYAQHVDIANEVLKKPLLQYHLDDAKLRVPAVHTFSTQLPSLVLMYQLTGDTVYANRAWQQLEVMATYNDWGANRHFLDAGIGAFDVALAYDGLYDYLSVYQKQVLREAVKKFVLQPGKEQLQKKAGWSVANHNWNGICNGGIIMAALCTYEDDPGEMSEIIALAANGLPRYINAFEPDGQSEEGLGYWSYGLMYTTIALESMQRVMGTSFGLDKFPGFKKTGWFPSYVSGPVTSLSIGDDPVKNARSKSFFWFAKNNNDTALAIIQYELCKELKSMTWMDMLYYDPGMISKNSLGKQIPLDNYIHGIEVMSLRNNWGKEAMFVSMHGGKNNANHGHLDAGSFDIQAFGKVWAYGDLGSDNYNYPGYFSGKTLPGYTSDDTLQSIPGRWHFYRLRAEGKNCLVINPSIRPDQYEKGVATLLRSASVVDKGFYIVDLSDCYQRDVEKYERGISLDRKNAIITVQDDFISKKSAVTWWQMHTKADINISADKLTAVLTIDDQQLVAKIISPANAAFMELSATYLPGQSFPLTKNTPNNKYRKLVIKLDNMKEGSVRVDFSAAKNKGTQNAQKNMPLTKWH